MKFTRIIISAAIICIFIIALLVKHHRPKSLSVGNTVPSSVPSGINQSFPDSIGPVHIQEDEITDWAKTSRGRNLLCEQFGDAGNGLDTASLTTALMALLKQQTLEQVCLQATIRRLNLILMQESLHDPFDYDVGPERALERKLLLTHGQEVSSLFRESYGLGGANPKWEALGVIEELQLTSSCDDLSHSMNVMSRSSDSYYDSLRKTFSTVCSLSDQKNRGHNIGG